MAEDARYRGHVRTACDHQTGGGVPQTVYIELLRQAVLFQDALEPPCEGGGRHRQTCALPPKQEVIGGQLPLVIGFGDIPTFFLVLPQETFHLGGEVHIAITCAGLGFLDEDLLVRHLDRVAADMDGTLFPINVAPLQSAALAPPHPRGDDELEVGFVLDALALQRGDDLLRRFLIRDLLFALAPDVAVGAPSRIMRKKATLHGIREDAAQRSVHALNGVLGEWLFCVGTNDFSQFGVEIPEVLRPQLVEPLFDLPGRQSLRRVDGFLPGVDALAVVVIAHGDHGEIAAAALADALVLDTTNNPLSVEILSVACV